MDFTSFPAHAAFEDIWDLQCAPDFVCVMQATKSCHALVADHPEIDQFR